jgi:arylsulfatase
VHFAYDGGGLGKGGELTLLVDGEHVGSGRLERSTQYLFSQEGTFDVGIDRGAQVTNEYKGNRQNAYNGVLHCVEVMLGSDAVLPTSAQSFAAALAGH